MTFGDAVWIAVPAVGSPHVVPCALFEWDLASDAVVRHRRLKMRGDASAESDGGGGAPVGLARVATPRPMPTATRLFSRSHGPGDVSGTPDVAAAGDDPSHDRGSMRCRGGIRAFRSLRVPTLLMPKHPTPHFTPLGVASKSVIGKIAHVSRELSSADEDFLAASRRGL